jgi:two-component system KDP operon response regulator KdpE
MKALLIGLDSHTANSVAIVFRARWPGTHLIRAETGRQGLRDVGDLCPDFIIVDISLPDVHWLELVEKARAASDGVLIAVARGGNDTELVAALEAGADDYLETSTNETLLGARLGAALRRARGFATAAEPSLRCGSLVINPDSFEVHIDGQPLYLTPTEFKVLHHLARSKGHVVTQQALESMIWGSRDQFSTDCLRKYIRRLRQKLEEAPSLAVEIVTLPRIGYKLVESR